MRTLTRISSEDSLTFPPVLTKEDFTRRYLNNEFGNRSPSWDTLEEYLQSGYQGLVHIRNRVAGGPTWYNTPAEDVHRVSLELQEQGHKSLYYSGMCPTEKTVLQGELRKGKDFLELYYSYLAKPMRQALREDGRHSSGVATTILLHHFLDGPSLDWLRLLLDRYPNHIIEFTTLSVPWGTIPHMNTLFWEVRSDRAIGGKLSPFTEHF